MFRESRIPLIYNFNLSVLFMEEKRIEREKRRERFWEFRDFTF
jgi:hypothetical protein